jgi:hypothetical protein
MIVSQRLIDCTSTSYSFYAVRLVPKPVSYLLCDFHILCSTETQISAPKFYFTYISPKYNNQPEMSKDNKTHSHHILSTCCEKLYTMWLRVKLLTLPTGQWVITNVLHLKVSLPLDKQLVKSFCI